MNINQIYCGESKQTLKAFPEASIDLVITDPPYLCNYKDRSGRTLINDNNPQGVLPVFDEIYRVMKEDSYCISFYGWTAIAEFSQAWIKAGFKTVGHIVWAKEYASRSGHAKYQHESAFILAKGKPKFPGNPISDVQKWVYSGNKSHPTEKSVSILTPLVKSFSKPGDLVLDPFSGSGSTSVAAALNNRDYIGIELEQKYCDLATKRLRGVERKMQMQKSA